MRRALILLVVTLAISAFLILYGQRGVDIVLSRLYQPSPQIADINARLAMTHLGTDLFYASAPKIEDKTQFNASCETEERTIAILGCYFRRHIYLFDVKNKELDGTLEVTAAHEMLHAAYERLNFFERTRVNSLIEAEYATLQDSPSLKQVMAYYAKSEPGEEINELHSLLGTTVVHLSPELEAYYSQYFKDRASVVALNAKYNAVFDSLRKKSDELQKQLVALRAPLESDLDQYESDREQIELDIASFNERAKTNGFPSQSSFTVARNSLIMRVETMNTRQADINQRVKDFNTIVEQINALAVRANELSSSINGATTTKGL